MPDEPEVHGLVAMMLLLDARRESRFADGELVLLADQDLAPWDRRADRPRSRRWIARWRCAGAGRTSSRRRSRRCTPTSRATGPDRGPVRTARARDRVAVVELNRAVAIAEAGDAAAGLELMTRGARRLPVSALLAPNRCAAWTAATRRARPTSARWRSPATRPSGDSLSAVWPCPADSLSQRLAGRSRRRWSLRSPGVAATTPGRALLQ